MFVLPFAYVFGGAIPLPDGGDYKEFLMPGIFAQTIVFASATTAVGMADDMGKGLIDRFRSLPMARSAVLAGRTVADTIYQAGILVVLMLAGLAVGWRVYSSLGEFLLGVLLLLAFAHVMAWLGIWIGLSVPNTEAAQQLTFVTIFPLTFISNVFVPPEALPEILQPIAEWNPVSTLTAATRELFGNPNPYVGDGIPAQHPILVTIVWMVVLVAIFAPLGIRKYRNANR
jgi:ABC transporter DrrB family efflux protein